MQIGRLRKALDNADAVVVGAGAGLSTAAGYTYSGPRFSRLFGAWAFELTMPRLFWASRCGLSLFLRANLSELRRRRSRAVPILKMVHGR